jgi:hypothetical protein
VDIGAESRIIGEIPTWVIWVVVYRDVVGVPQPVAGVVIVVRRDTPVKAAEPETVPASSFEAINVVAANFAAEASVLPGMVKMVVSIAAARIVTDPMITFSVNVRSFGMALLVAIRWASFAATGTAAARVAALHLSSAAGRRGTSGRNVAAADVSWASALVSASAATSLPAATSAPLLGKRLGKCGKRQNQEYCKQTR